MSIFFKLNKIKGKMRRERIKNNEEEGKIIKNLSINIRFRSNHPKILIKVSVKNSGDIYDKSKGGA